MILKKCLGVCLLSAAVSLSAENLLQNPEFTPAVYEGKPHGALFWRFFDWTRRNNNAGSRNRYYTGDDLYRFDFGVNSFSMTVHPNAPLPEIRLSLEDNGTLFLPPAPAFMLSGEYLLTQGKLAVKAASAKFTTLPVTSQWKELNRKIVNQEWLCAPLRFNYTLPRAATFGVRNLKLEAVYPSDTGRIFLPGGTLLQRIVIPAKPAYKELIAAEFWRAVFWKITGCAPKVVRSDSPRKGDLVLRTVPKKGVKDGSYAIRINADMFCVEAQNPDAHWPALWNYARNLGVRIFSAEKQVWPKDPELKLAAMDKLFTPRVSTVYSHSPSDQFGITAAFNGGLAMQAYLAFADDWYGLASPHGFHNLQGFLPYSYDKHPEYYPMNAEGKRVFNRNLPQLCYSSSESPKLIAKRYRIWVRNHPEILDFSFEQNDGVELCMCPDCKKRRRTPDENTDNTVFFLNQLAKNVPEARISALAYTVLTKNPPSAGMKAEPNTLYQYCTRYNDWKCQLHVDCELNRKGIEQVKGWAKFLSNDKKRLLFYLYENDFTIDGVPGRLLDLLNQYGDRTIFLCNDSQLGSYGAVRWNWGDDYLAAVQEYMRGIYGQAAPAMIEASTYLSQRASQYVHTEKERIAGTAAFFPFLFSNPQSSLDREGFEHLTALYNKALLAEQDPVTRCYILLVKNYVLMQYIARFSRSSCKTQQEIDDFIKRLNAFIDSNAELFNIRHPLAKKWPFIRQKYVMNNMSPTDFFARYTGIDLQGHRKGDDWTKSSAILNFKKNPSKFMVRMPKTVHNEISGCYGSGATFWDADALLGGCGKSLIRYQCPPREGIIARRMSSGEHVITAEFILRKRPVKEQLLFISGQDNDKSEPAQWKVEVNDKVITEGKVPFVKSDWTTAMYRIPVSVFSVGMNTIRITNITPEPQTGAKNAVVDQNGTFMGEGVVDYKHGWLAISSVMLCDNKGDQQTGLPERKKDFKKAAKVGLPVILEKEKTYTVKGEVKSAEQVMFHIIRMNSDGKDHPSALCDLVPDSATVLHFQCRKGDKSICVKDASKWKTGAYCAAFNLQEGFAKANSGAIKKITKEQDLWKVELYKPLDVDRHAGLSVGCGRFIQNGKIVSVPAVEGNNDWRTFEFTISGSDPALCKPGTRFFRLTALGEAFSLRNVSITH